MHDDEFQDELDTEGYLFEEAEEFDEDDDEFEDDEAEFCEECCGGGEACADCGCAEITGGTCDDCCSGNLTDCDFCGGTGFISEDTD